MGMAVKYVGPKDFKTVAGQRFARLKAVDVPSGTAASLLMHPDVFLPADEEAPEQTLAQRERIADAMEAAGRSHIESYELMKAEARLMPNGQIGEKTGKPDDKMQKRLDSIKGAQDEIDHGQRLVKQADEWRAKVATEKRVAAAKAEEETAALAAKAEEETQAKRSRRVAEA